MVVKAKERKEMIFQDVKIGQVFRDNDDEGIYMKVSFEDDHLCCPRCNEDIHIGYEKEDDIAVELSTGLIFDFNWNTRVKPIQGYFIEE